MLNIKTLKVILVISLIFSLIAGFFTSYLWIIQQLLWVALAGVIYIVYVKRLEIKYRKYFIYITFMYLIFESLIKILLFSTQGTWLVLNSAEHFIWGVYFSALIFSPLAFYLKGKNKIFLFFVLISIINLVGVMNEFVEFLPRNITGYASLDYYKDSLRDLMLNILGSLLFIIGILLRFRKREW